MLVSANTYEGRPVRLYRSPIEIRRDIDDISARIREADEMLSVRGILMELLSELAEGDPERWVNELFDLVSEAKSSLDNLRSLNRSLDELTDELYEVRCVMGL